MSEENPVGRPPHVPTDESRQLVSDMVMCGITHKAISAVMHMCEDTLVKHYRYELDTAKSVVITKIGKGLVQKAYDGDTTSQIFYLKTQGEWKDKPTEEAKPKPESELYALRKL